MVSMAPSRPTKLPKHESATATRNISCVSAQPWWGFVLEKLKLGWSPSRSPEDSRRRSTRECARKGNTSITSPSTNFSMTQRRKTRSSGNTYLEVIGNGDAGGAEEADQSTSRTGFPSGTDPQRLATERNLVIGKGTPLLGRATELGFTLR
jgi:hypothetical protein